MIEDNTQLAGVLRQLQRLELACDGVWADAQLTPFQKQIEVAGIEKMIARLREEIESYQSSLAEASTTAGPTQV